MTWSTMSVESLMEAALNLLTHEREVTVGQRESGADDAETSWAIQRLLEARCHLGAGDVRAAKMAVADVSHKATDSWSLSAPVTDALARCNRRLLGHKYNS